MMASSFDIIARSSMDVDREKRRVVALTEEVSKLQALIAELNQRHTNAMRQHEHDKEKHSSTLMEKGQQIVSLLQENQKLQELYTAAQAKCDAAYAQTDALHQAVKRKETAGVQQQTALTELHGRYEEVCALVSDLNGDLEREKSEAEALRQALHSTKVREAELQYQLHDTAGASTGVAAKAREARSAAESLRTQNEALSRVLTERDTEIAATQAELAALRDTHDRSVQQLQGQIIELGRRVHISEMSAEAERTALSSSFAGRDTRNELRNSRTFAGLGNDIGFASLKPSQLAESWSGSRRQAPVTPSHLQASQFGEVMSPTKRALEEAVSRAATAEIEALSAKETLVQERVGSDLLSQQVEDLRAQLQKATEENHTAFHSINRLQAALSHAEVALEAERASLAAAEAEAEKRRGDLAGLQVDKDAAVHRQRLLQAECGQLKSQVAVMNDTAEAAVRQAEELSQLLERKEAVRSELQNQVDALQRQLQTSSLLPRYHTLAQSGTSAQAEDKLLGVQKEVVRLQAKLSERDLQYAKSLHDLASAHEQVSYLQQDLDESAGMKSWAHAEPRLQSSASAASMPLGKAGNAANISSEQFAMPTQGDRGPGARATTAVLARSSTSAAIASPSAGRNFLKRSASEALHSQPSDVDYRQMAQSMQAQYGKAQPVSLLSESDSMPPEYVHISSGTASTRLPNSNSNMRMSYGILPVSQDQHMDVGEPPLHRGSSVRANRADLLLEGSEPAAEFEQNLYNHRGRQDKLLDNADSGDVSAPNAPATDYRLPHSASVQNAYTPPQIANQSGMRAANSMPTMAYRSTPPQPAPGVDRINSRDAVGVDGGTEQHVDSLQHQLDEVKLRLMRSETERRLLKLESAHAAVKRITPSKTPKRASSASQLRSHSAERTQGPLASASNIPKQTTSVTPVRRSATAAPAFNTAPPAASSIASALPPAVVSSPSVAPPYVRRTLSHISERAGEEDNDGSTNSGSTEAVLIDRIYSSLDVLAAGPSSSRGKHPPSARHDIYTLEPVLERDDDGRNAFTGTQQQPLARAHSEAVFRPAPSGPPALRSVKTSANVASNFSTEETIAGFRRQLAESKERLAQSSRELRPSGQLPSRANISQSAPYDVMVASSDAHSV